MLKVKCFYRQDISDEQYFAACDELLAYAAYDTIELEDVPIKDKAVFNGVESLVKNTKKKTV